MIADLRKRGYNDGYKAAKEAKNSGRSIKSILGFVADDKVMAKKFMEEFKVCKEKAFRFGIVYSFGYDHGVLEAVYE